MTLHRSQIALIHVAKQQIGWDEDVYKDALFKVTGKTSSKDLTQPEFNSLMAYMEKQGFKSTSNRRSTDKSRKTNNQQQAKIFALWQEIKSQKLLRNPDTTLERFLQAAGIRIGRVEWLSGSNAQKAIEYLKAFLAREQQKASHNNEDPA
ncbi:MAG: regulatory protein GemA [Alphaproteobacteria bacterium]|nr:regulatory protein GemA [Alphaproteobacteria bacterium]MDD9919758.1 regulatory protein GemA [Alphaproteobacteria bacterium]